MNTPARYTPSQRGAGQCGQGCDPLCCERSLVDTSVVGTRSARELAALGPGTMLCDGNAYIFTFLAAASEPRAEGLLPFSILLARARTQALLHPVQSPCGQVLSNQYLAIK